MTKEQKRIYNQRYYQKHKAAVIATSRAYAKEHPPNRDKARARYKRYYQRHPDKLKAKQKRDYKKRRTTIAYKQLRRDNALQRLYGITLDNFNQLVLIQNGLCAICKLPPKVRKVRGGIAQSLCVDHNHTTTRIRELLCADCNLLVGQIEKNRQLVTPILQYLDKHQ